jgi:LPS O-antigen subunit length determinant protein (WzzB/FepE family)
LQQSFQNIAKRKELLASQVAQLKESLQMSLTNRKSAAQSVTSESSAMTLLLLDDQIEKDRTRLVALQDRLLFQLEENEKKIEGQLADNLRKITLQKNKVAELQDRKTQQMLNATHAQKVQEQKIVNLTGKMSQLQNTEPLAIGLFSEHPISPKKPLIVALSMLLGLMGSVILVFVIEYVQQHKQELD